MGGIGHDALATNKLVEAGMVFCHGLSCLHLEGCDSGCSFLLLCFWGIVTTGGWRGLLPPGTFLWDRGFPWICLGTNCIPSQILGWIWQLQCHWHLGWSHCSGYCHWSRINRQGWVHGQGLHNHSHLEPPLYGCFGSFFFSAFLGTGVLHGKGFLSGE